VAKRPFPSFFRPTPWVPTDIGGCIVWFRSDLAWQDAEKTTLCVLDEDLVYLGEDKCLTHGISQATSGKRPKFYTNQINGIYPAWRFNGTTDMLVSADAFAWAMPATVYIVLRQISWTNSDFIYDSAVDDAGMGLFQYDVTPKLSVHNGAPLVASDTLSVGSWGIVTSIHNGASSSIRLNAGIPTAGTSGSNSPSGFTLGRIGSSDVLYGNFDVAEIIGVAGSSVSVEDDALTLAYLNGRYAIY
jgi:hypothetical protein